MKIYPFKIPKQINENLVVEIDQGNSFYNKLHQHEEIQVAYIVKGQGKLIISDSIHPYTDGDIFIIGGNSPHLFKSMDVDEGTSHMITEHATFSAEVGGCMGECGSASGMAAAGVVVLQDGTLEQSLAAASIALQSSLGLICDTVADRVEALCLNRNVMASSTAISCANMALSDYDQVIPLDEVIDTMKRVGNAIHHTLRCTGLGGLAITKTAREVEVKLEGYKSVLKQPSFKNC